MCVYVAEDQTNRQILMTFGINSYTVHLFLPNIIFTPDHF